MDTVYARTQEYIIALFDVRDARATERVGEEIVGGRGSARLYALDPQIYALVIRPGGARQRPSQ